MRVCNLFVGLLLCLFKIALDLIFSFYITKNYSYYVYTDDYSLVKLVLMYGELILFIPFFTKFVLGDKLKDKILMFLTFMYYVPGLSVYQFIEIDITMFLLWNFFWWSLIILSCLPAENIVLINIPYSDIFKFKRLILNRNFAYVCIYFTIIVVLYISCEYTGLRFNITFTDEYILREEERKIILPKLISYLYSFSPVVLSILIAYLAELKRYMIVSVLVVFQCMNFSIGGHKTILLMVAMSLAFVVLKEIFKERKLIYGIILILSIEPWIELLFAIAFDSMELMANISRRVYIIPQLLNTYYYEFFSCNGFDYYAQGFMRFLGIHSEYTLNIQTIIANEYYGTNGNANNGLFSEAYSNMGGGGCIILPIAILLVIRILDFFLRKQSIVIKTYFSFLVAFIFGSGNVTTGLFTNGLLISALILYLLPNLSLKEKDINDIST